MSKVLLITTALLCSSVLFAQSQPADSDGTTELSDDTSVEELGPEIPPLTKDDFEKSNCRGYWKFKTDTPSIELTKFIAAKDKSVNNEKRMNIQFAYTFTNREGITKKYQTTPLRIKQSRDLNYTRLVNYLWKNYDQDLMDLIEDVVPVVLKKERTKSNPEIHFCVIFDKKYGTTTSTQAFRLPITMGNKETIEAKQRQSRSNRRRFQ